MELFLIWGVVGRRQGRPNASDGIEDSVIMECRCWLNICGIPPELIFDFCQTCLEGFDVAGKLGEEEEWINNIIIPRPFASVWSSSFHASRAGNFSIAFDLYGELRSNGDSRTLPRSASDLALRRRMRIDRAGSRQPTFLRLHSEHDGSVADEFLSGKTTPAAIPALSLLSSEELAFGAEAAVPLRTRSAIAGTGFALARRTALRPRVLSAYVESCDLRSARARFAGRPSRGLGAGIAVSSVVVVVKAA